VTASLFISKLQSFPRQNVLARALQEYGRLVKTLFILRYLESEAYRRQINIQLNKGEALHALRRFIFFANQGKLRWHHHEDQANQASCLNLVTNAVVTWNTVYMTAVIEQLKTEGAIVQEEDFVHLSPARYEHVNPYGKYQFVLAEELSRQKLRPLRQPSGPWRCFLSICYRNPKTRNAKVMRRVIRAAYLDEDLGDISSLEDPDTVEAIREAK